MLIIMILVMRDIYMVDRQKNILSIGLALVFFLLVVAFNRTQTPIGNVQFLRSMIPHHSSAILMCQQANITDPEIVALCDQIMQSQQKEIDEMKAILERSR